MSLYPVPELSGAPSIRGLTHYDGTIGDRERVRMTLQLGKPDVYGTYFYFDRLKEIPVRGRLGEASELSLDALDSAGNVVAQFLGQSILRLSRGI